MIPQRNILATRRGREAMTIAIVGVGETDYQFRDPRPAAALAVEAVRRALDDAGLSADDVDGFVSESYSTVQRTPVDEIAHRVGVKNRTFSVQHSIAGAAIVGA